MDHSMGGSDTPRRCRPREAGRAPCYVGERAPAAGDLEFESGARKDALTLEYVVSLALESADR
jgi:hypothetical protein